MVPAKDLPLDSPPENFNVVQGQLVADAAVTLDIVGRTVTQAVQIPLTVGGTLGEANECDILNLAVGPLDLDLLGLVVELDDCAGGPVTVDITAVGGDGQLLGNLLCGVAGLLDNGLNLGAILGGLTADELGLLTGTIAGVLNGVFDELLNNGIATQHNNAQAVNAMKVGNGNAGGNGKGNAGGGGGGNAGGRRCDILDLELNAVELNLLGLKVETSDICLQVYAERGQGNLLGSLLCGLVGLLDNPLNTLTAQLARVAEIVRLINRLGL
jgi:hypothetical protein